MIITIDSEIQSLLLDWYNLEDVAKDKISHMLTDTGIKLQSNGKKGTTVIQNKIHHSYRSNEIRYLILKLITRGEVRFSSIDILNYFYNENKIDFNMNILLFSRFVADNFTDTDIEYFNKYCDKKFKSPKDFIHFLEIPNIKIQEYFGDKILNIISESQAKLNNRASKIYNIDLIYKVMNKKCISVGRATLTLKKCTDDQNEYIKFMKFFPESEKYMALI